MRFLIALAMLAIGVAIGAVLAVRPASAEVWNSDALTVMGDGVTVACDTTPALIDDTDVANTIDRWLICRNESANTVRFSTTAPTAATPATLTTEPWQVKLAKNAVMRCYAASASNINCQEAY